VVTTWTEIDRQRLAELYREQDELMAAPKSVLYRRFDPNERAPAGDADSVLSDADEGSTDQAYPPFSEFREDIAEFTVEWVNRRLAPRDERIAKLETQITKLETQVQMLTALLKPKLWTP
jgi:hypothetical protein